MLTRTAIIWVVFAAVMGFAVGGSIVSSFYAYPQNKHDSYSNNQSNDSCGENCKKTQSLWVPTDSVGLYTLVLAVFTGLLVGTSVFQGYFLIRADKTSRIAAEAAKRSADAAVRVNQPFLGLKRSFLMAKGQNVAVGMPLPPEFEPIFMFTNWGNSPAEITHGCIEWSIVEKLPPTPKYMNTVPYAPGIALIHRADIQLDVPCKITLTPSQIIAVDTSQEKLWVFGFIRFKDFLGESHDVRFCLKWVPRPTADRSPIGFVWDDETPPEYTRR